MNPEPQIVMVFSPDTINLVLAGLNELPHGRVRGLFDQIRSNAQQQMDAHTEALRRATAPPAPAQPETPPESPSAAA